MNPDKLNNDNLYNFQSLNKNILKNFDRLNYLNEKCSSLESFYLSKIITRINEKITYLEESLDESIDCSNTEENDIDKIKNIEFLLQDLEKEFDSFEETTGILNLNISEKINRKIEENYKILSEIEIFTNNKIFNKINNEAMENLKSASLNDGFETTTAEMNENWLEKDCNNFVYNQEEISAVNYTENFKQMTLRNKLLEIENRVKKITAKDKDNDTPDYDKRKSELLRKLILTEKKITELRTNLIK